MHRPSRSIRPAQFAVLGAFVAVAIAGLAYGLASVTVRGSVAERVAPVVAPDQATYEAAAREAAAPFLSRAASMTADDISRDADGIRALAASARESLLRLRVPASRQEAHLALVLAAEQWRRAADGSAADREAAPGSLAAVLGSQPWLLGGAAATFE